MFVFCGIIQPSQEGAGNGLAVTVPVPLFRLYGVNKMDRDELWQTIIAHPELIAEVKAMINTLLVSQRFDQSADRILT